jgi:predicted ester cyclase
MTDGDLLAVYRDYLACLNDRRWDDLGRFVADGEVVSCRLVFRCTPLRAFLGFEPTGERISFAEHVFYGFDDRRIAEVWSLIDKETIREQVSRNR